MPRGPGKRENYNLDYSRFNYLDKDDDGVVQMRPTEAVQPVKEDATGPMPDIRDVMRTLPPELQEAFHLMQIAKQNGDEEAQKRANELALKAVDKGGPEVKQKFLSHLAEKQPDVAEELGYIPEEAPIDTKIDKLRTQMEKGREEARKQMEMLSKQQEQLERLQSPDDVLKFMHDGGMSMEDMQRMFAGDQSFMEEKMKNMIDKSIDEEGGKKLETTAKEADKAVKATEVLHSSLMGAMDVNDAESALRDIGAGREPTNAGYAAVKEEEKKKKPARPAEPPKPTVKVADYRLQYQRDDDGKYTGVELKCSLPGVDDMSLVVLDISEEHLRLSTVAPAPAYVVNAGPFPVCIDPNQAKAKFSKKRAELSVSVPAKTDAR
eukprot:TRINITY_DN76696_c0_g1_i1.p1 TRINITY_DN76696_c0_g1~~TRINITY_DN76696_c0_g1_i1.p1  ORF type:complete len:378 (+),score=132.97 TRINITY_DN76696_c0_g1_i1:68-1201(+)